MRSQMVQFVLGKEVDEVFSRTKTEKTAQIAGQKVRAVTYHAVIQYPRSRDHQFLYFMFTSNISFFMALCSSSWSKIHSFARGTPKILLKFSVSMAYLLLSEVNLLNEYIFLSHFSLCLVNLLREQHTDFHHFLSGKFIFNQKCVQYQLVSLS